MASSSVPSVVASRVRRASVAWPAWIGHADVRLHVWIVLAAVGRLEWALAGYTGLLRGTLARAGRSERRWAMLRSPRVSALILARDEAAQPAELPGDRGLGQRGDRRRRPRQPRRHRGHRQARRRPRRDPDLRRLRQPAQRGARPGQRRVDLRHRRRRARDARAGRRDPPRDLRPRADRTPASACRSAASSSAAGSASRAPSTTCRFGSSSAATAAGAGPSTRPSTSRARPAGCEHALQHRDDP